MLHYPKQYVNFPILVIQSWKITRTLGITDSQYQIIRKFQDVFGAFWEENGWPPKFIDTPEWNEITEMAKEVLKGFNYEGQQFKH